MAQDRTQILAYLKENQIISTIAAVFLSFSLFYLFFPVQYKYILGLYMFSLFKGASIILTLCKVNHIFNSSTLSFVFNSSTYTPDTQYAALKTTFAIIAAPMIFFRLSKKERIILLLSSILIVYFINTIRVFFILKSISVNHQLPGSYHFLLFQAILFALPLLALVWHSKGNINQYFAKSSYNHNMLVLQKQTVKIVFIAFLLCILIVLFHRFTEGLFNTLTTIIFTISKFILSQFSILTTFNERIIYDRSSIIYMGDPCVGLYIIITFLVIIMISKGTLLHKAIYSTLGILIIVILNAVRISLLFAYLHEDGTSKLLIQQWHGIYNNVIYASVFVLWLGWFWVQKQRIPEINIQ